MSRQQALYLTGFGDNWFDFNKADLGKRDTIMPLIDSIKFQPKSVLEIGCANGWRLKTFRAKYGCEINGLDPSGKAIVDAAEKDNFAVGTAQRLPYANEAFDLVIFGFCLYVIDPEDWFLVIHEATRVLQDRGIIAIHDFYPPCTFRRHHPRTDPNNPVWITHFNWPDFFCKHPFYRMLSQSVDITMGEATTLLQKRINAIMEVSA